jgi:hypothetical protein
MFPSAFQKIKTHGNQFTKSKVSVLNSIQRYQFVVVNADLLRHCDMILYANTFANTKQLEHERSWEIGSGHHNPMYSMYVSCA